VTAINLGKGNTLETMESTACITKIVKERHEEPVTVYNLAVKDWVSYFVGQVRVYVHNGAYNGDSEPKITLPENDSQLKHIFRKDDGHIIDTPENIKRILDVANDSKNYLGKDIRGNEWYAKIESDNSQTWVRVRNLKVDNAGVNIIPKKWNNSTVLYNNVRRNKIK